MSEQEPRFSDELLADLHAGVLSPEVADELWPQVYADSEAMAVIASLDDVSSTLSELGSAGLSQEGPPIPVDLARTLDAMWAVEDATVPTDPAPAADVLPFRPMPRRSPNVRWEWLAVACALVGVISAAGIWFGVGHRSNDNVQAGPPTSVVKPSLVLGTDLPANTLYLAMGHFDATGTLSDAEGIRSCLTALGIERLPLGAIPVEFQGHPAVLILAAGPQKGLVTAVIVNRDCAPGNSVPLATKDF